MSGGSFNYAFAGVRQMADSLDQSKAALRTIAHDLRRMAEVMHAIEWEEDGDAYHAEDAVALYYGRCFQHTDCVAEPEVGRACFRSQRADVLDRVAGRYPALANEEES